MLSASLRAPATCPFFFAPSRSCLRRIQFPTDMDEENFASVLCDRLGEKLNGTGNLSGASLSYEGGTVSVPAVSLDRGTFTCQFIQTDADSCRLEVVGRYGDVSRRVARRVDHLDGEFPKGQLHPVGQLFVRVGDLVDGEAKNRTLLAGIANQRPTKVA